MLIALRHLVGAKMSDQADGLYSHTSVSDVAASRALVQEPEGPSNIGTEPPYLNSAVDADPIVNLRTFEVLVEEIGDDAAHEFLNLFITDTEDRLKMLRHLSFDAARETIEIEAHSLKSAAGTFGLQHVSQIARRLERECRNIDEDEYCAILDQLEAAFEAARIRLPL